jgi:hypothetical protein
MAMYAMWVGPSAVAVDEFRGGSIGWGSAPHLMAAPGYARRIDSRRSEPTSGDVLVSIPTPVIVPAGRAHLARVFFMYRCAPSAHGSAVVDNHIDWVTVFDGPRVLDRRQRPPSGVFDGPLGAENTIEFKDPPAVMRAITLVFTIFGTVSFSGFGADFVPPG